MPGTLTVSGASSGLTSGSKVIGPLTMTGSGQIGEIIDAALAIGDNTFAIPSGASAVLIAFVSSIAATVKIRTNLNSADGGLAIGPFNGAPWAVIPLVSGVTSVIVNSTATVAGVELSFI